MCVFLGGGGGGGGEYCGVSKLFVTQLSYYDTVHKGSVPKRLCFSKTILEYIYHNGRSITSTQTLGVDDNR